MLNLAAVAGRHFDFALLQALTELDEAQLLRLLKELIAAQLIVEESAEQFAFRHALTQQAVYAQLLVRERKVLHARLPRPSSVSTPRRIEAHLADLASHYSAQGRGRKRSTMANVRVNRHRHSMHRERQLTTSRRRWMPHVSCLSHLLLACTVRVGWRTKRWENLSGRVLIRSRRLQLAHDASDRHAEWQALLDLGSLWAGRDYAQSGDYYQQALALARTLDDLAALAHSLNRLGNWYLNAEQPDEALRCHQEALTTFQALSDRVARLRRWTCWAWRVYSSGDLPQSAAYSEQAIALLRELDERQRLPNSLANLMLCGGNYQNETAVPAAIDFAESLKHGELALKIAGEIGQSL